MHIQCIPVPIWIAEADMKNARNIADIAAEAFASDVVAVRAVVLPALPLLPLLPYPGSGSSRVRPDRHEA